jgi:hypothetical protein
MGGQPEELEEKPQHIVEAHKHSWKHRAEILASRQCGCFDCCQLFSPDEVNTWIEEEGTALCPRCGNDTVLPEKLGLYFLTTELLKEMHIYWCDAE